MYVIKQNVFIDIHIYFLFTMLVTKFNTDIIIVT